jgi:WD40 repeat protein
MGADDNTADTRRRVSFDELVSTNEDRDVIQQVLLTLANARLITTEQDAVEVAHEALIREWPTLRNWLEEDRESLRLHRHLTQAAQEWGNTDRDPSGLYRGARLAQALEWAESHVEELNLLENAFLEASHELAEKEIKEREAQRQRELDAAKKIADEQARAAKLQRSRALWLTGAFVIAIGLAVFAFISRFNAQREAAVNRSLVLAGLAVEAQESGEVDKALALGLEAVDINEPPLDAVSKLVSVANDMGTYAVLTGHTGEVRAGAFGPDSSQVISGGCLNPDTAGNCSSGEMILWDLSTRTDIARWPGHAGWVTALAWTPDGHNVLSGGDDGRLILWDASRQDMLEKWDFQKGGINEIAVSPGENVIGVAHQDGSATLLNLSNRQIVFNLQGHSKPVLDISFSPDGKLVLTSSEDNTMILWDVASGEEVRTFLGHTASVCGAVFLPDGKHILSSSSDMTHRLWDVETGEELQRRESGDTPDGMVLTPDGKTVLHRVGHIIYTWDLESFTGPHKRLLGHVGNLLNLAISSDGRFALSTGEDGTVRIWNLRGSDEFEQIELGFSATSMAVAPDGKSAAIGGWGEYAILWDLNYSKPVDHLPGITGIVAPGAMTFSPDGNWIAAASGDYDQGTENASLIVWNASTGEIHCDLQGHARRVRTVAFSPDSRFVLSGSQGVDNIGDLILWDVNDCSLVRRFDTEQDTTGIDFSDDGKYVFTSSAFYENATLWEVESGKAVQVYVMPDDVLLDAAFGPNDETVLGAAISGVIVEWDRETGQEIRRFAGHDGGVWSVTLSPNENYLASSDDAGTIILWDIVSGKELQRHNLHNGLSFQVAFSPGSDILYSVSDDETLVAWRLGDPSLPALLTWIDENRYVRELTCEERAQYNIEPLCRLIIEKKLP